jgi:hypothetical protein
MALERAASSNSHYFEKLFFRARSGSANPFLEMEHWEARGLGAPMTRSRAWSQMADTRFRGLFSVSRNPAR